MRCFSLLIPNKSICLFICLSVRLSVSLLVESVEVYYTLPTLYNTEEECLKLEKVDLVIRRVS